MGAKVLAYWLTPQMGGEPHFEMVTAVTVIDPPHSVSICLILNACVYISACEYMDMRHVFWSLLRSKKGSDSLELK